MSRLHAAALVIFCTVAAAALCLILLLLPNRLVFKGGDYYCFYLGDTSLNCSEVRAAKGEAAVKRLTLKNVCGESATYARLDIEEFLKEVNGEVIFCERLSDSVNYYCTADLPYSVKLYGREINLHVCVKESGVTVASPIIFGGY